MVEKRNHSRIDESLEKTIRDNNPWWRGERIIGLPPIRRWAFEPILKWLTDGLTPAVLFRGPRQVGKTTLMMQMIEGLLNSRMAPKQIVRLQFDELPALDKLSMPILDLAHWYADNILGKSLNQAALDGEPAFFFLDEVQIIPSWAPQLKHLVDINPVRALVTGSSALRIAAGRDSLAGRVMPFEMGPLLLREIAEWRGFGSIGQYMPRNGLAPLRDKQFWLDLRSLGERHAEARHKAFDAFSEKGAYPIVHKRPDLPWEEVAELLVETVIRRVIIHDLVGGPGGRRDEHLLEEVFRVACRHAGQYPTKPLYLDGVRQGLPEEKNSQRVFDYVKSLEDALLFRLIEPLEIRLRRRQGGQKICLCDHALRAAWLQEIIPLSPEGIAANPYMADLAGRIAESTAGYFLSSIRHLDIAHFPPRGIEREIDFILTIGEQRIPVEIKYQRRIDYRDTYGLRAFIEKAHYNAPFGLLITQIDEPGTDDPRIVSMPLSTLLLMR